MIGIKLCGLSRLCDIEAVNELRPQYIGFVFAKKSRRFVSAEEAAVLKKHLHPDIRAVGVFVDEDPAVVGELLERGIIDMAQLHGKEDEAYIAKLRQLTAAPIIKAFRVGSKEDAALAESSSADYVLLDSGAGTGRVFDWDLIRNVKRPYFLAGGLGLDNVTEAIRCLHPYGVDVSSGIETDGKKDRNKMAEFVAAVRKEEKQ